MDLFLENDPYGGILKENMKCKCLCKEGTPFPLSESRDDI
jgi:hypothetical protein